MLFVFKTNYKIILIAFFLIALNSNSAKGEQALKKTYKQELRIIEEINKIDYESNQARKKMAILSKEIISLEKQIDEIHLEHYSLSNKIQNDIVYTKKRLKALYKMSMLGKIKTPDSVDSVFDFFVLQKSLEQIIIADFKLITKQNIYSKKLLALEKKMKKEFATKLSLETKLNDQIAINKKKSFQKQSILNKIKRNKTFALAAEESFKKAASQLDDKINRIKTKEPSESSFPSYKGKLLIPVKGEIISKYGPLRKGEYQLSSFQKGIDIKVDRGEPIKSVFKGKVKFAKWLNGYGNVLIIDHGDNYYTLYAHVEEFFKQEGSKVKTGEIIAIAGDTGSIKGSCLHFELRHRGIPVNPIKWFRKSV